MAVIRYTRDDRLDCRAAGFCRVLRLGHIGWTKREPVLRRGAPGDCDAHEIGDVAIMEHEGRWYMVYQCTPTRTASRRFALAVSDDLWHWEKLPGDGSHAFTPHPSWSGWQEQAVIECKGPFIFRHEERYLMYYSSESRRHDSCIALATSEDMVHWEDEGPFITTHKVENWGLSGGSSGMIWGGVAGMPGGFECPRVRQAWWQILPVRDVLLDLSVRGR